MSQQGEGRVTREDDWWHRLYDEAVADTGAVGAADSLDDRFDSAAGAVGIVAEAEAGAEVGVRDRGQAADPVPESRTVPGRAPWERPAEPTRPRTFEGPRTVVPQPVPVPRAEPTVADGTAAGAESGPGRATARPPAEARAADGSDTADDRPRVGFVGDRPPTYDAEPTALPATDPDELDELDGPFADTVLDGASYGSYVLRAASVRGDSARFRGEPRRDSLLTVRFGTAENALVLVAVAGGGRAGTGTHRAAADLCRWIARAVGRSHARLCDDIRADRRPDLRAGLHRLTDRGYGRLRTRAAELRLRPEEYTAGLRCLLLPTDPECRTRVVFGEGPGGLFRLRDGAWQDLEPRVAAEGGAGGEETPDGERPAMAPGDASPPAPYDVDGEPVPPSDGRFLFRVAQARPGDTLLLCGPGLADPVRGEPALTDALAGRWTTGGPPGLAAYLADIQLRAKGYADDRTGAAVWEA
ncbi:protein phosphatase 2C domain-containing protein [Streptomyces sp. DT24]|uniref:protein phosphatase 2C domain-containing protein n=1 Tax=Streptomyces sp. DT24 TaxID=3416520 RepID=UPI003CF9D7CA